MSLKWPVLSFQRACLNTAHNTHAWCPYENYLILHKRNSMINPRDIWMRRERSARAGVCVTRPHRCSPQLPRTISGDDNSRNALRGWCLSDLAYASCKAGISVSTHYLLQGRPSKVQEILYPSPDKIFWPRAQCFGNSGLEKNPYFLRPTGW